MKRYTLCMAIGIVGCFAVAQEQNYTQLGAVATTGTATNLTGTTGTALQSNIAGTTASEMIQRSFSQENFDKRWETEVQMYKDAGISEEKIQKLKDINQKMWNARAKGESADFQELSRQRREILSPDEIEKLRNTRRDMIQKRMSEGATTGTGTM